MTPIQRAKKIFSAYFRFEAVEDHPSYELVDIIAAQISEAEREAEHRCYECHKDLRTIGHESHCSYRCKATNDQGAFNEGFSAGFTSARDMAGGIADGCCENETDHCYISHRIARRIAKMEPKQ